MAREAPNLGNAPTPGMLRKMCRNMECFQGIGKGVFEYRPDLKQSSVNEGLEEALGQAHK